MQIIETSNQRQSRDRDLDLDIGYLDLQPIT